MSSSDTLVSTPHDTCIPISYGLNSVHLPRFASCPVNFERFTARRLSYIPGIVKLCESPGRAGGLLRINYSCDPVADFSIGKNYSWVSGSSAHRVDSLVEKNIRYYADQFLKEEGFTLPPDNPDFMVSTNYELEYSVPYKVRTLNLYVYGHRKGLVWQGTAAGTILADAAPHPTWVKPQRRDLAASPDFRRLPGDRGSLPPAIWPNSGPFPGWTPSPPNSSSGSLTGRLSDDHGGGSGAAEPGTGPGEGLAGQGGSPTVKAKSSWRSIMPSSIASSRVIRSRS